MTKEQASKAAHALDAYMRFRAEQEGVEYGHTPEWFRQAILLGIYHFYGVTIAGGQLVGDEQQPELFDRWQLGERANESVH
jgi:hypothetical protein